MPEPKNDSSVLEQSVTEIDPDIVRYEKMPASQINRELRAHGINPDPTIAAVNELVESRLGTPQARRAAKR